MNTEKSYGNGFQKYGCTIHEQNMELYRTVGTENAEKKKEWWLQVIFGERSQFWL